MSSEETQIEELFSYCREDDVENVFETLEEKNISLNVRNKGDWTLLIWACYYHSFEVVKLLLNFPKRKCKDIEELDLNEHGPSGWTALMTCCWKGYISIVELLLHDKRTQLNLVSAQGKTPISIACEYEHLDIVQLLLKNLEIDINKPDDQGCTPLMKVCRLGFLEIVEWILGMRMDVEIHLKNLKGETVFNFAENRLIPKEEWENDKMFNERVNDGIQIIKLLESYSKNRQETVHDLREQLNLLGFFFSSLFSFLIF